MYSSCELLWSWCPSSSVCRCVVTTRTTDRKLLTWALMIMLCPSSSVCRACCNHQRYRPETLYIFFLNKKKIFFTDVRNSAYSGYPELWILRYPAHRYHAVPSPGFEPTTLWLRVRRPSHSAMTLHILCQVTSQNTFFPQYVVNSRRHLSKIQNGDTGVEWVCEVKVKGNAVLGMEVSSSLYVLSLHLCMVILFTQSPCLY
jgi:hypothetical protein